MSTFGGNRSHLYLRAGASVAGFIVDSYCHKSALVVEVDGDIHDLQQEEDARREKALRELGLRTCADGSPVAHRVEALSSFEMTRS